MLRRISLLCRTWILRFALVSAAVLGLSTYVHGIEPNWYEVRQVSLILPHLAPEFSGYRVVQLSDIHADRWMTSDRLQRVVAKVNQQNADLILLTGDFVTRLPELYSPTLTELRHLKTKDGSIAVLGNHDVEHSKVIKAALSNANIRVLENQFTTIQRQNQSLHVAGVGDVWFRRANLEPILTGLPRDGAAILLAHEPDFADTSAATERFDLQLSGHSHGGQVHLPPFKRLVPALAERYPNGQYQVGSMIQYTNRGIGSSPLHLRFNCRPEITVFTLRAAS
jgi:uncharacterized protein